MKGLSFFELLFMAFINPELAQQMQENPQAQYSVIITLKGGPLPQELTGKGKFIMGDQLFSATLNGEEIQSFIHHAQVEAIEPDREMGIL